jgi:hypothetical protein
VTTRKDPRPAERESQPLVEFGRVMACMPIGCAAHRVRRAFRGEGCFQTSARKTTSRPSPGASPRLRLHVTRSFRVPSCRLLLRLFRGEDRLPGFRSSSRHHRVRPLIARLPNILATVRPQVFSTSRRFPPHSDFAGLSHPAATSRITPSRGFPSPRSHLPSSGRASLLAVGASCRSPPESGCHGRRPRLRGLYPRGASAHLRLTTRFRMQHAIR